MWAMLARLVRWRESPAEVDEALRPTMGFGVSSGSDEDGVEDLLELGDVAFRRVEELGGFDQ